MILSESGGIVSQIADRGTSSIAAAWEVLHGIADLAVIVAVVLGIYELFVHRKERTEQAAAIDDHIRVLAAQAYLQIRTERVPGGAAVLTRLSSRGTVPGDLLSTWLTVMAAEAPRASPKVRRAAMEAARMFFDIVVDTTQDRLRHSTADPVSPRVDELGQLQECLRELGGIPTPK